MKILKLTTLLDFGGQEKQYISFTDRPELLKNEYVFASIGYGGYAEKVLKERGFEVKVFDLPVAHKHWRNILIISRWMKAQKLDIVHTAASEANFHGVLAAKLAGVPVIIAEQIGVPNSHSAIARRVFGMIYRLTDRLIAISENVKNVMVQQNEAEANKIEVVLNPVSTPVFYPKILSEKFQWVFASRLVPRKNTITLIKAFSRLSPERRGVLHIVGDGIEKEYLEKEVGKLKLGNEILFHGFQTEPEKFISQADVFVLPAFDEGFGIVVIEAMLQKKACLCGKGGGIPEYLTDNVNGWFFDPYSVDDMIVKMENILQLSKEDITKIGERAYEKAVHKFTVKNYIENVEYLYSKLYN
jgi:glycosyltransferase involved in cell wall biosynthesis